LAAELDAARGLTDRLSERLSDSERERDELIKRADRNEDHIRELEARVHTPYTRCVYNYPVIFSLKILNLYWDSLPFRGGPKFLYGIIVNASYICSISTDVSHNFYIQM
jgi:hypothetical protein